jgi:hypothetical protein
VSFTVKTRRGEPAVQCRRARTIRARERLRRWAGAQTILDAAWDFDAIPRRTKALVAAVIARGLGDDLVLSEAWALAHENGVDAKDFDDALAHFTAAGLLEKEKMAIAFARETIWYEPAPMQRRTAPSWTISKPRNYSIRRLASFANLIARLGVFADTRTWDGSVIAAQASPAFWHERRSGCGCAPDSKMPDQSGMLQHLCVFVPGQDRITGGGRLAKT